MNGEGCIFILKKYRQFEILFFRKVILSKLIIWINWNVRSKFIPFVEWELVEKHFNTLNIIWATNPHNISWFNTNPMFHFLMLKCS